MGTILFLIFFPMVIAFILLVAKADKSRDVIVIGSAAIIAIMSIVAAVQFAAKGEKFFSFDGEVVNYIMMAIEAGLCIYIIITACKHKKWLAAIFAIIQTPLVMWFELTKGHGIEVGSNMYVDRLSVIMILIIGIIGSLITVYALGYMKDFQHHEPKGAKDRRPWFFFVMFLFLGAMVGLVTSNNMIWMYFFWEITSLSSFWLIGYTKTEEATNNAFRALIMNLLGGLGFAVGIVILGTVFNTVELSTMIMAAPVYGAVVAIPAAFFAFAGITKAAQMPFNSWLLGAMVAPTPTSALLHSSTMVKAGVFMIIKLAPVLSGNFAGLMVMMVGGITFLFASCAAISQTNAKRVLAYSTIANLGLIVACGGVGTPGAVWAGIMLIIFHAITKSLLFLCVGTAEHHIGSRMIEDMDGLFNKMPRLAMCMIIGIAGMFLAPFGMLISKWGCMVSFVDSGNILLIGAICFGSAVTAFYWLKWMGKLTAVVADEGNIENDVHGTEIFVHVTLVALTVLVCLIFPLMSSYLLVPYLEATFGAVAGIMASGNMLIMVIMVAVIVLLSLFFFGKSKKPQVPIYLAGVNTGDNRTYYGSMQQEVSFSLRNWHMEAYFGEYKMNLIGDVLSVVALVVGICYTVAVLINIVGGAF